MLSLLIGFLDSHSCLPSTERETHLKLEISLINGMSLREGTVSPVCCFFKITTYDNPYAKET